MGKLTAKQLTLHSDDEKPSLVLFLIHQTDGKELIGKYSSAIKDACLKYWEIVILNQDSVLPEIGSLRIKECKQLNILSYCSSPAKSENEAINIVKKLMIFSYYARNYGIDSLKSYLDANNTESACKVIEKEFNLKFTLEDARAEKEEEKKVKKELQTN